MICEICNIPMKRIGGELLCSKVPYGVLADYTSIFACQDCGFRFNGVISVVRNKDWQPGEAEYSMNCVSWLPDGRAR